MAHALAAADSSRAFTLDRLLALPNPGLVTDVLAQLHHAGVVLRRGTRCYLPRSWMTARA